MSHFPNVVATCEVVGDTAGDKPGAKRVLNGVFRETLLSIDPGGHTLTYSIDDGPEAVSKDNVSGYIGEVRLSPVTADGRTFVEWSSRWEKSGGGVAEFCAPIYQALLSDLAGQS
jgi:hypothetical protein